MLCEDMAHALEHVLNRLAYFENNYTLRGMARWYFLFEGLNDPFNFMSIDGGTLNNEPFGETEILLKRGNTSLPKYSGIVLIDPFPNFTEPSDKPLNGPQKRQRLWKLSAKDKSSFINK